MNQNDYSLQCLRQWDTGTPLAGALLTGASLRASYNGYYLSLPS
ncbi:hypothetical protein VCRA2113O20_160107 [Vibrio crassostreae]|nr:hypothetical protein VCRA2116O27_140052 [Vibrio crassostreae]CAK1793416.1 hypothetical protein VCRA2119O44_160055 [Vibrio crassostreae]CAK1798349.1 hypothetical protein VCRA2113O20_160107 [Vibrio crassostreae]CAK1799492.1 hypothetical protein VCRA2117O39_160109 [Vibrio crassostreae]CAK2416746.1 hypothetical protein VCRA2119O53_150054 [Vibrio crassostreae]